MIPKKIHYCWFGSNPLPKSAHKCIMSWKKYFPDYEIIQWNEENFDVNAITYTSQAYAAKKFAFVSDYARLKILYENGGLYFDTDVEVIKSFEDILSDGAFMGCEISSHDNIAVNPGLGIGVEVGHEVYKRLIELYKHLQFLNPDGTINQTTIVTYTTDFLKTLGLKDSLDIQNIEGILIYPKEYFNPLDDNTGILDITDNTRSIHWYSKTWLDINPIRLQLSRIAHRFLGYKVSRILKTILHIR